MTTSGTNKLNSAEQTRQNLAEVKSRHDRLRQQLDKATVALADVDRRARVGDEALTAAEMIEARTEVERVTLAVAAAERSVTLAARAVVPEVPELAEGLAQTVETALGVPVTVAVEAPKTAPAELPAVVIVQAKPNARSFDGSLSGPCQVFYIRTQHHTPLDVAALALALDDNRIRTAQPAPASERALGGAVVDVAALDVKVAFPRGLPTIARAADDFSAPPRKLGDLGQLIANSVAGRLKRAELGEARNVDVGNGVTRSRKPNPSVDYADVVNDGTDGEGVRTITGRVGVGVLSGSRFEDLPELLDLAAEPWTGRCFAGLGRIESIQVGQHEPISGNNGHRIGIHAEVRVIATSLVPGAAQ